MYFLIQYLSEIAGIVSFSAYSIYIISVFRGQTKPSRSTWWILTLVGILIFATSHSIGAQENMWIQLSYIIGPLAIAILSTFSKYGYKEGFLNIDKICLVSAIFCAIIWLVFDSPFLAFLGSIIVDFVGLVPTIIKTYFDPLEEDWIAWGIEFFASILNTLSITSWFILDNKSWIYALYLLMINGIIFFLIMFRRGKK